MQDAEDERLADYVRLRDVQLRKSLEAAHGLFIAEGEKVIRRAVETGYPVRSMLMARRWTGPLADLLDRVDAPVYVAADDVVEAVAGFPVHRGALAAMSRIPLPTVPALLSTPGEDEPASLKDANTEHANAEHAIVQHGGVEHANTEHANVQHGGVERALPPRRILVLEDLVDHGNVGAIYRCAAALGVDAVVLSPRCADPLYRRAVKVSMGAVFAIPYARMTDWHHGLEDIRKAGFRLLALTPDQSATPVGEAALGERTALMLGTEGDGLSSRWLREADERVRIPMSPHAMAMGVDSLNVVAAAAIACHSLTRS